MSSGSTSRPLSRSLDARTHRPLSSSSQRPFLLSTALLRPRSRRIIALSLALGLVLYYTLSNTSEGGGAGGFLSSIPLSRGGRNRDETSVLRHKEGTGITGFGKHRSGAGAGGRMGKGELKPSEFDAGRVVIWEEGIHDEVTGAIGWSLDRMGIRPTYNCWFRHEFPTVLSTFLSYKPEIITPHGDDAPLERWLEEGKVDNIILNTCALSLPKLTPLLLPSTAHVTCIVHHSGTWFAQQLKTALLPFVQQRRVSIVVLGEHVQRGIMADTDEWAEREGGGWEDLEVGVLVPVFDYPAEAISKLTPKIFPTRAVLQGNIEQGRRDYTKAFKDLLASMTGLGGAFEPDPSSSPFELYLLGSVNPSSPVKIPDQLVNVIKVKSGLSYPDFYTFIAESDILIPAFAQRSTYESTSSSSIAAGISARTPILVSDRHIRAYTYVQPPAVVHRNTSWNEMASIAELRRESAAGAAGAGGKGKGQSGAAADPKEWKRLHDEIVLENARMWGRVLKRVGVSRG